MIDPSTRSAWADRHFSDTATYSRFLDVEKALAQVQADLGIIPVEAADAIAALAPEKIIDRGALRQDFETVGFPIVGFVKRLATITPDDLGQYAHWGATTQDVMDTGLVLALRKVMDLLEVKLQSISRNLSEIAETHAETLIAGRSQLQHAVPMTFGAKVAVWIAALDRHANRLQELRPRVLMVQFGGAVGTMAAVHPHGPAIRAGLADALDLHDPHVSWHTARDGLAEFVSLLGLLTGTLAKIATDIALLAQTEVGEVREPSVLGRGTSSTMPHKQNPVLSQQVIVAARALRGLVPVMLEAMVQDHERGTGVWPSEWGLIPDACNHAVAVLDRMEDLTAGLIIDTDKMAANIGLSRQFVYAETVMMALAPHIGRQRAHDLVETAVHRAEEMSFKEALLSMPEIAGLISAEALKDIFAGETHQQAGHAAAEHFLATRL